MQVPSECRAAVQIDGVVQRVDLIDREVEVYAGGTIVSFDVRPDCVITLRGERVKLRLIQIRDRVRVTFTERQGGRVADAVEVSADNPAPL